MIDQVELLGIAVACLAGLMMAGQMMLRAFRDWIDYKRFELTEQVRDQLDPASGRIEIADLRERVRKLEAIAAGIDP